VEAWLGVYRAIGLEPPLYVLNADEGSNGGSNRFDRVDVRQLFSRQPAGSTPLPEVIAQALRDHAREAEGRGLFLLVLTDGEANSMGKLNSLLDAIQNGVHGDVQVCLSGLSLLCAQRDSNSQSPEPRDADQEIDSSHLPAGARTSSGSRTRSARGRACEPSSRTRWRGSRCCAGR